MSASFSVVSLAAGNEEILSRELAQLQQPSASLYFACGNQREVRTLARLDCSTLPIVAFSSCLTSASSCDAGSVETRRLQLFAINDPQGAYGKASAELDLNAIEPQVQDLLRQAMHNARRSNELPALIWCLQMPGYEEQVLSAIAAITGPTVPILGGSSADDEIAGLWCQFDGQRCSSSLLVLLVLYPSCPLSYFFSSGYHQLSLQAKVTKVSQRRLFELDHQPAGQVYNQWLETVTQSRCAIGKILQQTALLPFGRQISTLPVPLHLLTHPAELHDDGSISLMSDVASGDQLYLMMSSEDALVRRAGHVVGVAIDTLRSEHQSAPAAAIVFYCAGCMLTVRARYHEVQQQVRAQLGNVPFLIAYTFGEQGCFPDGSNRHGNLMISALLFGSTSS